MRIAINGTGVAGPTLAYWLRRFGHEPILFEKAPALRTGGYVIDFWGLGFEIEAYVLAGELHRSPAATSSVRLRDAKSGCAGS